LDLQHISLLIGKEEPSIFKDYMDCVANKGPIAQYKAIFQFGTKHGESLYTHVITGIFLLETLRSLLSLSDEEARVLYTAFTVHDINKALNSQEPFNRLATKENIAAEIRRLELENFFPSWRNYLEDITSLVRGHAEHQNAGGELWLVKRNGEYGLGLNRVNALVSIIRAIDIIDLSNTLEERRHKATFLSHLNTYLANSGKPLQYDFTIHRLSESRGLLSNVIHNAIVAELRESYGLVPLLFYPNGVAYLIEREQKLTVAPVDRRRIAERIAEAISSMTEAKFQDFISSTGQGIKVDAKCLELSVPFPSIWREIYNIVQRRNLNSANLERKARERAEQNFDKNAKVFPHVANAVKQLLAAPNPLVTTDLTRLRIAELARTYYIFLNAHFKKQVPEPWEYIYSLLELPEVRWPIYAYFDVLYDRPYVIAQDIALSEEEVYRRIEMDGAKLMGNSNLDEDHKIELFDDYLKRYALFGWDEQEAIAFRDHLTNYVNNQHQQCVYCSGPFPTAKWMTADVRSDITVQTFSNRLRGGSGEPKKYICAVCQIQFLLEKLNYPAVRNEKTLYLHLFPYSFLTEPFIQGLYTTIRRIITEDSAVQALNLHHEEAIRSYLEDKMAPPAFRARTAKGKPQPYGIYLPRYADTVGNLLIFPLNPAGDNDTQRFLFTLWNALVLQRHLGVKVLLSNSPIAPLGKEEFDDLYVDSIPLTCVGLLPHNNYSQFEGNTSKPGSLPQLWEKVGHLFNLQKIARTADNRQDEMTVLVRALAEHPLTLFYATEKLLEAKARAGQTKVGGLVTWLSQQAFPHVEALALSKGGVWMTKLSEALQSLAKIAWQEGLRGRSLEKNSLLFPLSEVFQKLGHPGGIADRETLKAAAAMDIFDHLNRIADEQYKPGRKKWEASKAFVDTFFEDVLDGVYGGNVRKLLADEKLLRSAFLFYMRELIPRKELPDETETSNKELLEN
jgi:CRISPR-associated protein Csc3